MIKEGKMDGSESRRARREQHSIFTVGHSTQPLSVFLNRLELHHISFVADVRSIPRSRHNPQYNKETLSVSLAKVAMQYRHMAALGGLRRAGTDALNAGWENASFRGFADYMQTADFRKGLEELIELSGTERLVIMCAEALPWRCHRSLISDAILIRGFNVLHIMPDGHSRPHTLTAFSEVDGMQIAYPAKDS
jgi:uncharacterized protein (DUF488 family)